MNSDIVIHWMFDKGFVATPVEISSGVELVEEADATRFISRSDWHSPTKSEKERLTTKNQNSISESITIVKFDESIIGEFYQSSAALACIPNSDMGLTERRDALMDFAQRLASEIPSVGLKVDSIRSADVQITPSGAESTAFDHENNRYIGLHIDNHDKLPIEKRQDAFHLLAINFGNSERHFQFINLGVLGMLSFLSERINVESRNYQVNTSQLTSDFLKTFPNYPVTRVTLPPGYGYVAVTQSLIHDGEPNKKGDADIAFLLAGKFSFTKSA